MKRDRFLTEAMGECWHEMEVTGKVRLNGFQVERCKHCGKKDDFLGDYTPNDFSTWEGFGKLWEWTQKQEWWIVFCQFESNLSIDTSCIIKRLIHPDRFADAVYEFLRERDTK